MGDLWLPGLPPAYTDYANCLRLVSALVTDHNDAVILAAIPGNESGYDYRVINDTPATGDYSIGLWQINYYDGLYDSRVAAYGTPRQLIEGGPPAQARAAVDVWQQAGGFSPWATTVGGNLWQKYVGSGPIPHAPGGGPAGQVANSIDQSNAQLAWSAHHVATDYKLFIDAAARFQRVGRRGWQP